MQGMRTQIYILYNYELYILTIKIYIYVYKYVSYFFLEYEDVSLSSKGFVLYFCNHDKNLYNKFSLSF